MRVWVCAAQEPIPYADGSYRLFRAGMLTRALARRGHTATWWTSAFDHMAKRHRFLRNTRMQALDGVEIRFLSARSYRRNISLARVGHNRDIARGFTRLAGLEPAPDAIWCALPIPELADAAVGYASRRGIPIVLDIRDQWPSIYLTALPEPLRPLARIALTSEFRRAQRAIRGATAVVASSQEYLDWGLDLAGRARTNRDTVFPLGYPLPAATEPSTAVPLPDDRLKLVFVGTFGASYDLHVVLDAAERARTTTPLAHFVLVGDGDQGNALRARAAALTNVTMTGWLSQSQIEDVLRRCDVGLIAYAPEATQTMPNKPFEYWSAGLPVISSLRGELAEMIERHRLGFQYRAGDAASLSASVAAATNDPDQLRSMGANAAALFAREFSEDAVYPKIVDFIEGIAS